MRSWPLNALAIAALVAAGCPAAGKDAARPAPARVTDVTAKDYVGPALPKARVTLKDVYGGAHRVEVEVAATGGSRERGLMWRTSLPEGTGMLFIFPHEQDQQFWMKNTLIPLDMIFLGKDLTVNGVVARARPGDLSPRGVGKPGIYVLEVPAGWAERAGLAIGVKAELSGTSMIAVEN